MRANQIERIISDLENGCDKNRQSGVPSLDLEYTVDTLSIAFNLPERENRTSMAQTSLK